MSPQGELKGTERPTIAALDEAMERYVKIRNKRMSPTEQEVEARQAVEKHMQENKLTIYRHSEQLLQATLIPAEIKAKVKSLSEDEPQE